MSWQEDELHRWLSRRPRPALLDGSRGHDAAVLAKAAGGRPVICVDQTIEGVHFEEGAAPKAWAAKAVARTLSDLAATAAEPEAILLAFRAPSERSSAWMRSVLLGAEREAAKYGACVVAGDLAAAPGPAALSVTALGRLAGKESPGRDRAEAGQVVLLTGPCGGSLPSGRHLSPQPKFAEGQWLFRAGATAMMDVSDGVAIDLHRIARASKVRITLEDLPVHRDAARLAKTSGRAPAWHALHDGEDYELFATISPSRWKRVAAEAAKRFPRLRLIGRVETGRGLQLSPDLAQAADLPCAWKMERGGFLHGS
ncbi:MAG: thiamine-phosphate kinase [Planctomycetota bacterium]